MVEVRNEWPTRSFDILSRPSLKWQSLLQLAFSSPVCRPWATSGTLFPLRDLNLIVFGAYLFIRIRTIPIQQVSVIHLVLRSEAKMSCDGVSIDKQGYRYHISTGFYPNAGLQFEYSRLLNFVLTVTLNSSSSSSVLNGKLSSTSCPQIAIKLIFIRPYAIFQIPSLPSSMPCP